MLLSYLCAHGAKLCDMDKAQKQQGRIVLFKEEKDGVAYVRIDFRTILLLYYYSPKTVR